MADTFTATRVPGRISLDGFSETLRHLQALHDQEVSTLLREVARLRGEVDHHRTGSKGIEEDALMLHDSVTVLPRIRFDLAETSARGPTDREPSSKGISQEDSKESSQGRPISREVSKCISQKLLREIEVVRRSMSRQPNAGSVLLSQYSSYRWGRKQTGSRGWLRQLVLSPNFDFAMAFVIILNAVAIGFEASTTHAKDDVSPVLQVAEYIFLFIYTVELCMRFVALGCSELCNTWVQFDLFLVLCGCLDIANNAVGGTSIAMLDHVLLVRTFRLARLARVLRLMIKFHTLWMLVQGLLNSLMTLVWTCIIICILLFVFSVLGLELLQPDPMASQEYNDIVTENFGSLFKAMTSLLQGMTLDSFSAIYRPVMLAKPLMVFYFVPFLLIVSIALMNLVTALMVNFSLEQATKDKEMQEQILAEQKSEMIRILEQAFRELDTNHSGQIGLKEMLEAPEEIRELILEVASAEGERERDITDIFTTLDFDKSGYLEIRKFCQGLLMLQDRKALESYFITSLLSKLKLSS